jgi:hypothetical protein
MKLVDTRAEFSLIAMHSALPIKQLCWRRRIYDHVLSQISVSASSRRELWISLDKRVYTSISIISTKDLNEKL